MTADELLNRADSDNAFSKPKTPSYKFTITCKNFLELSQVFLAIHNLTLSSFFKLRDRMTLLYMEVSFSKTGSNSNQVKQFIQTMLDSNITIRL